MRYDIRNFELSRWAAWTAAGKPTSFSVYGNSGFDEVYQPRERHRFRSDRPLWRREDQFTDRMVRIDSALHGGLSDRERQLLFAAVVPAGRPVPASERAEAAGVAVEVLRSVRRRALELI